VEQARVKPVIDYARGLPQGREPVRSRLGQSIIATIFFWPLGLVAIVHSVQAILANRRQQYVAARLHSERAANWGAIALLSWLLIVIAIAVLVLVKG